MNRQTAQAIVTAILRVIDEDSFSGPIYRTDVSKDQFVHFTTRSRAEQISRSGKLLMKPPYPKFGADHVAAVSVKWGSLVPGVQTTHINAPRKDLAAVLFTTTEKPSWGYPEEVVWHKDVPLKSSKIITVKNALGLLRKTPFAPGVENFQVTYK